MAKSHFSLQWQGEMLKHRMREAAEEATRETLEAAAQAAQSNAPVATGAYRDSIQVFDVDGSTGGATGTFGSDLPYAPFVEFGSRGHPGSNTLRSASDIEFGKHEGRVRMHFK